MAADITVQLVKDKLIELQNNKQLIPRVGRQVEKFIDILMNPQKSDDKAGSYVGLNPKLLQAVFLAEDIIDTFHIRTEFQKHKLVFSYMHLKSLYIQTGLANKMEKLVSDLTVGSSNMQSQPSKSIGNAEQPEKKTGIFGVDILLKELAELILNDYSSPFHISVADVAGSAKTTELRKIYDNVQVKDHFKCRAWVHVAQEFEKRKLLTDILEQVSITPGTRVEAQEKLPLVNEQQLRNFLIRKRYLVILIDVRTPDIWEILKYVFPNSSNGSRVIFSFRAADAVRNPDTRFYGRALLVNSNGMQVSSAETNDVDDDVGATEQQGLNEDLDPRIFDEDRDIVGLEDKLLELAKLTLRRTSDKHSLISVVGMAGSGKTTLVKTIYNNSFIRRRFDCRAWVKVYVSHDFDMRNVLIDILKQVTQVKDEEGLPLDKLETKLRDNLSQRTFLIVLDDVHLPGAWYDLERILSPKSSSGSRVILITRDNSVALGFSPSIVLLQLRPLNEDESWKLFLKKVSRDETTPGLRNLKEKVWQKCRGLPLAISVLGGLLSTKNWKDSEWSKVIEQFMPEEKKQERVIEQGNNEDGSVIEDAAFDGDQSTSPNQSAFLDKIGPSYIWTLGYKDLSPHLRACLDYLCLFPKSYEIPVRRLFQLWLAERFVTPKQGEQPEDQVKRDFEELERRNMIEVARWRSDGRPKTFLVPSTLYDTFFQNAEDLGSFHVHRKSDSTSSSQKVCIRRLAEHLDIQNNPPGNCIEYLHSYLSFKTRKGDKPAEEVGNFLNRTINKRGFGLLRVLDLEHVYKPVIHETLGKLKLLRYVGLRWTFLDSIPMSIGDLPCLETLDLKHTNITTLPVSIWRTKTLRHLYMNEIDFLMSVRKPIASGSLTNLQTLWGLFIGNKDLRVSWLGKLHGLRKLGLTCHTTLVRKITELIGPLGSLQSLRLRSINDFGEPSDLNLGSMDKFEKLTELYLLGKLPRVFNISELPQKLEILTLSVSQLSNDPMPLLGKLEHLKILRLFAHSYTGEQIKCLQGGFPKLRVLKLWVLKELKEWTIEKGAMPALKELEIRCCQKLIKPDGLENVVTLKELILTSMGEAFVDEVKKCVGNNTVTTVNDWTIDEPWD